MRPDEVPMSSTVLVFREEKWHGRIKEEPTGRLNLYRHYRSVGKLLKNVCKPPKGHLVWRGKGNDFVDVCIRRITQAVREDSAEGMGEDDKPIVASRKVGLNGGDKLSLLLGFH